MKSSAPFIWQSNLKAGSYLIPLPLIASLVSLLKCFIHLRVNFPRYFPAVFAMPYESMGHESIRTNDHISHQCCNRTNQWHMILIRIPSMLYELMAHDIYPYDRCCTHTISIRTTSVRTTSMLYHHHHRWRMASFVHHQCRVNRLVHIMH